MGYGIAQYNPARPFIDLSQLCEDVSYKTYVCPYCKASVQINQSTGITDHRFILLCPACQHLYEC